METKQFDVDNKTLQEVRRDWSIDLGLNVVSGTNVTEVCIDLKREKTGVHTNGVHMHNALTFLSVCLGREPKDIRIVYSDKAIEISTEFNVDRISMFQFIENPVEGTIEEINKITNDDDLPMIPTLMKG